MNDSEKFRQTLDPSMSEELEVIRGIADLRQGGTGAPKAAARVPLAETEPEEESAVSLRRTPWQFIRDGFINMLPNRSDDTREIVRKCGLLAAILVIIGTVSYLVYDMVIIPAENNNMNNHLSELYDPTVQLPDDDPSIDQSIDYPEGMSNNFKPLYAINKDVAGWITYKATGSQEFLDIDYPIVWSGDNDYYLYRNFYGNNNKNGTVFLDGDNTVDAYNRNRVSILYGHNMASGQMFAHINTILKGVYYARTSATFTYNTIYEENRYKVFALVLVDEDADDDYYFQYRRTKFSSDTDFMNYINELRAHSKYDYPVDVNANDEIVILSTCTNASQVKFGNGRLAVIARRVRPGESASVATGSIIENADVIMPLAWYVNQNLTPHQYYVDAGYQIPTITQTVGTTASTESTASGTPTSSGQSGNTVTHTNKPQNTTKPITPGTTAPTTPPVGPTVSTAPNVPTSSDTPSDTTDPNAPTSSDGPSDTTDPNAPTESQPTESEPTESQPTESQPTESEPTESQPTESQPTESEPTESQPTESEPTVTEPTENAPATEPVDNGEAA